MEKDLVTGATVEVVAEVDAPPEQVWGLVTAISRIGEWSPETVGAAWLDNRDAGTLPRVGARFEGRNRFGEGVATVVCEVIEAVPPHRFAWAVLDDDRSVERPGSRWTYELVTGPATGQTVLHHRFEHGEGRSGLREPAEEQPDRAAAIVTRRLEQLSRNMAQTMEAMTGAPATSAAWRLGDSVGTLGQVALHPSGRGEHSMGSAK
jgi:uncharacterized protein YndB with AHSA1/START domain